MNDVFRVTVVQRDGQVVDISNEENTITKNNSQTVSYANLIVTVYSIKESDRCIYAA